MTRWISAAAVSVLALAFGATAALAGEAVDHVEWQQRGKALSLAIYRPAGESRGTVVMAGGDVGWVGLAVTMSQHLAAQGYVVVGINVRQYLGAFTTGAAHMSPADIQRDYADLARYLRARGCSNRR